MDKGESEWENGLSMLRLVASGSVLSPLLFIIFE